MDVGLLASLTLYLPPFGGCAEGLETGRNVRL